MGGILCNGKTETPLKGLYEPGACTSVGIHSAKRLGSHSLAEIVVLRKVAGEHAARYVRSGPSGRSEQARKQADAAETRLIAMLRQDNGERFATLRDEMHTVMKTGVGIYRKGKDMQMACAHL